VELDFSMLVDAATGYGQVNEKLTGFDHPLLRRVTYVGAFEGGSVPDGKRSLTYRCVIGAGDRTLAEADLSGFRQAFESHVSACGFEQR
jgi:phenylalanyl-tRNA synthetase beta subunit